MKLPVEAICGRYGITRQAHYQKRKRENLREAEEARVMEEVKRIRQRHPRMGGKKLYHKVREYLQEWGIRMGRDNFFDMLGRHGYLVVQRRKGRRTTFPGGIRSENLLETEEIIRRDQAVVSDITYLETEGGFLYLALVTDLYSRKVVGWDVSDSLRAEGALRALKMAVRHAGGNVRGLIHHSDHGIQYTSGDYLSYMRRHWIRSSMGKVGCAYDNAVAERVNGILKLEYYLDQRFRDGISAVRAVREAIQLYNEDRPHCSLGMATPSEVYASSARQVEVTRAA